MNKPHHSPAVAVLALLIAAGCGDGGGDDGAVADAAAPAADADPNAPDADPNAPDARPPGGLSFFVTSVGNGANAGDYGGLDGADARCQSLAVAAGAGDRTWRAYLSTSPDGPGVAVDARDRIGSGPWFDAAGVIVAANVTSLHDDGVVDERMLDENGNTVPITEHDLLTGSTADGRLTTRDNGDMATCNNWTTNDHFTFGWVGHTNDGPTAWNDASHDTRCSQKGMGFVNGTGRLMCFAAE